MTDAELVERTVSGDPTAFKELVSRYQTAAQRAAYVVGGPTVVRDAVHEAFAKAFLTLHRLRAGEAFRPWLVAIVANEARNQRRSEGRREALVARLGHLPPAFAPSAEEAAVVAADRRTVLAAVNGLGDGDRMVIAYRYFLDLSEAETAQALGCAPGTVKSRLHRALTRLRSVLMSAEVAG
jgi:RNA polymerase sigma-70 factor (ECF subfamily)